MHLTVPELGVLFLLLFAVLHYLRVLTTVRAVLIFLGVVIVGSSGFIGRMLTDVGTWAQNTFGSITNWAIGVPLAAGLFIILAVVLIHDLHPKKGAKPRTSWVALSVGVLVVVGITGIPALSGLRGLILSLMGNVTSLVNGV